jgi:hypothetical protein
MFKNSAGAQAFLVALPMLLPATGCGAQTSPEDSSTYDPVPTSTGGGAVDTSSATGEAGSQAGGDTSDSSGGATTDNEPILPLPLTVTDVFAPSGFMGKEGTKNEIDGITMDPEGCPQREEGAVGLCYSVVYQPQELDEAAGAAWAGVFFQNPDANWGDKPGVRIEPGASKLTFTAWSKEKVLTISFLAGGVGSVATTYGDTFRVERPLELTSTPQTFELDLKASSYDHVLGGFGWVAQVNSLDPVEFFVDDLRWEK